MSQNIVTVKIGGDPKETQKVNDIALAMHRLNYFNMGMQPIRYWCYTDDPTGLETDLGIEIWDLELVKDEKDNYIQNPDYYKLDCFNHDGFDAYQKTMIWDINLVPKEMSQGLTIMAMPEKGDINEAMEVLDLPIEVLKEIKSKNMAYLRLVNNWWDDSRKFETWLIEVNGLDCKQLKEDHSPEDPHNFDLAEFLSTNHDGIILPTAPGIFCPYYVNNEAMNKGLNTLWDANVKIYFPEKWEGMGGDETDVLYYFDHEWKTINHQCKFMYMDEGDNEDRNTDLFLRKWVTFGGHRPESS